MTMENNNFKMYLLLNMVTLVMLVFRGYDFPNVYGRGVILSLKDAALP